MPKQPSLFSASSLQQGPNAPRVPLAERLRPQSLAQVVGHDSVLGPNAPLRQLLEQGQLASLLLWGPPGVGKTSLARLLAQATGANFHQLSAVSSGLKELRECIAQAEEARQFYAQSTVLFIDEIHRYSKTQQDALLPYVEQGTVTLIGATTENPSFQVIPALLSRLLLVRLGHLEPQAIRALIGRALQSLEQIALEKAAVEFLVHYANGDARSALTLLEIAWLTAPLQGEKRRVTVAQLEQLAQQNRLHYDRAADEHYDHASAYQKSLRGSDADAALYWLAKMIAGGEDPRFIARRLVVTAAEDVGLADAQALVVAQAAADAVDRLGMPEGRIPLALATAYVAKAPKSNAAYKALDAALADIQHHGHNYPVPLHLRDSHYAGASQYGHGVGYHYTHEHPDQPQQFLPEPLRGKRYLPNA